MADHFSILLSDFPGISLFRRAQLPHRQQPVVTGVTVAPFRNTLMAAAIGMMRKIQAVVSHGLPCVPVSSLTSVSHSSGRNLKRNNNACVLLPGEHTRISGARMRKGT